MYKRIMVPIDLAHTESAETMVKAALTLADQDGEITLVHVMPEIPAMVATHLPEGAADKARSHAKEQLQDIVGQNGAGRTIKTQVRVGNPHYGILEAADENSSDLIVIASHQPALSDYLLGSTAAKVVRHARCSVHVIR